MRNSKDIYQKKMDQAFDKCKGVFATADDIQVDGNDTNHDMHFHEVMERTRQAGIKLNYNKCVIKTKSSTFFGNVYTPQRVIPDPKKVEAIKKCRLHKLNKNCNLLGMVNYLGQFIKGMSQLTHNMRLLLKKCFVLVDRKPWRSLPEAAGEYQQWHMFDVLWYF